MDEIQLLKYLGGKNNSQVCLLIGVQDNTIHQSAKDGHQRASDNYIDAVLQVGAAFMSCCVMAWSLSKKPRQKITRS